MVINKLDSIEFRLIELHDLVKEIWYSLLNWQLSEESCRAAAKAVSLNKSERYLTFAEFFKEWKRASSSVAGLYIGDYRRYRKRAHFCAWSAAI